MGDSQGIASGRSFVRVLTRTLGAAQPAPIAAWALAVLVALSLLWIGGESHYRGCVDAAVARSAGDDALSRLVRTRDVESCSRLP